MRKMPNLMSLAILKMPNFLSANISGYTNDRGIKFVCTCSKCQTVGKWHEILYMYSIATTVLLPQEYFLQ